MLYLFALVVTFFVQDMSAAKYMCNYKDSCGCSRRPVTTSRILGDERVLQNTWSWTISLRDEKNRHFCGGSILNERYVITAAHCFANKKHILSSITVCAGTNRLSDTCRQPREIKNVINHPSYNDATFANDIALIQVKVPFNFTDTSIARICLPNIAHNKEYPKPGTDVIAVGWGENEAGQSQDMLKQVTVRVVDEFDDNCDSLLSNHSLQLCAAAPGKGTCSGDSGGPLMVFADSKRWELIGITSYGSGGCATEYPDVYTRVTAFLTWIQQSVNNTSSESSSPNFGVFTWSNGDRYEGEFKDGKMHGTGTLNFANGEKYIGDWVNGKRTGRGVFTWPNGNRYEGVFHNNARTGRGVYTWADGDRYEGQFKNNKIHGTGKMIYASGKVKNGRWSNGVFVN